MPGEVAIKIHRSCYHYEALREKRIADALASSGLPLREMIRLRDAFRHAGHACLVYDLAGPSLDRLIQDRKLTPVQARGMAKQVLVSLDQIHSLGIAHSDLKPENIAYDPESGSARVVDIGNAERRFRRGTALATREYTPPEVILGTDLTPAVDIWSLACVMFEALTGSLLFDPKKSAEARYIEFADSPSPSGSPESSPARHQGSLSDDDAIPMEAGMLLNENYQLLSVLGEGRFSVVWKARAVGRMPGDVRSIDLAREFDGSAEGGQGESMDPDRRQRKANFARFGVEDEFDLVLNHEHLKLMWQTLGRWDMAWAASGAYSPTFLDGRGRLKREPRLSRRSRRSIASRLERSGIGADEGAEIADLLSRMLAYSPAERLPASECLRHPWIRES